MWRFILICFAFLGWSFYELSGGADYEPRANSLQARAETEDNQIAKDSGETTQTSNAALQSEAPVTRSIASLADLHLSEGERVKIRLTSVNGGRALESGPGSAKVKVLTREERIPREDPAKKVESIVQDSEGNWPSAIELFRQQAALREEMAQSAEREAVREPESVQQISDIRRVDGDVVNLREGPGTGYGAVATLTKGTEVAVLEEPGNGWIELQVIGTGRTGWMADWLVTAAN